MSYEVLARKWRPQTFDEVVGQDHITRTLKSLARSIGVVVYVLSQVNREGSKDDWLQPHHIRDTSSLFEDCDVGCMIQHADDKVFIEVAKQRNGDRSAIPVKWDKQFFKFADIEGGGNDF